jgi:hypothetical protein
MSQRENGSCPAVALFPEGGSAEDSGSTATEKAIAAARQRLADGTVGQDAIGKILVHLLEHPHAARPLIALTIRELTPQAASAAAARLKSWLSDPPEAPEFRGKPGRAPDDMLEYAIALAILAPDTSEDTTGTADADASRRFRAANAHRAFEVHIWYARISPAHRTEAAARLAAEGLARPGGIVVPALVVARVNALIDLGPDQLPRVRELLDKLFDDGATSGAIRQPLAGVGSVYFHDAVIAALRSLTLDPGRYLPDRAGSRNFRGADRVIPELTALPEYRDHLVIALENIAANPRTAPEVRWRSAALLADLDATAHERSTAFLPTTGVIDLEAPVPASQSAGQVNEAWQRIEEFFAAHAPERLDELGPPAAPEEAARCQRVLGLTDEFAASLARHRYVYVHERNLFYEDIPRMLEHRRRDDGRYDLSEVGDIGADAREPTYLSRLRAFAGDLDAGLDRSDV